MPKNGIPAMQGRRGVDEVRHRDEGHVHVEDALVIFQLTITGIGDARILVRTITNQ